MSEALKLAKEIKEIVFDILAELESKEAEEKLGEEKGMEVTP